MQGDSIVRTRYRGGIVTPHSMVAIGMAAATFIRIASTVIAPDRIAEIEIARVRRRTDHRAADGAGRCTKSGIAGRGADQRAASRSQKTAARGAVTGISAATGQEQSGGKAETCR